LALWISTKAPRSVLDQTCPKVGVFGVRIPSPPLHIPLKTKSARYEAGVRESGPSFFIFLGVAQTLVLQNRGRGGRGCFGLAPCRGRLRTFHPLTERGSRAPPSAHAAIPFGSVRDLGVFRVPRTAALWYLYNFKTVPGTRLHARNAPISLRVRPTLRPAEFIGGRGFTLGQPARFGPTQPPGGGINPPPNDTPDPNRRFTGGQARRPGTGGPPESPTPSAVKMWLRVGAVQGTGVGV